MNHSIEKLQRDVWAGQFHRYNIDGKRRIMVWASALHRLVEHELNFVSFKTYILQSSLRNGIDYHIAPKHADIRLSISAVQAVLVMLDTPTSWHLHHALTDLIHRGFSNQ